jgi:hypothetical protein
MLNLVILNSSLAISITLQSWSPGYQGPLFDSLAKQGFMANPLQQNQLQTGPVFHKKEITGLGIDHVNRRIFFQITNNNSTPHRNILEVLNTLSSIGFPTHESIERIDIQGYITIKIQGDRASTFVPNVVNKTFIKKVNRIMERRINAVGIAFSTVEQFTDGISKSPYIVNIQPLLTDDSDTKFIAHIMYSSNNGESTLEFIEHLYEKLRSIVTEFKG